MLDLDPIWLTAKLALITTLVLFVISVPIAYGLHYSRIKFKAAIEAVLSMPLVLPPSVLGFYLLIAFSPENGFGKFLAQHFNLHLIFTFQGLVVASVLYSLPFMVSPILAGFKSLPLSLQEASLTLGKSKFTTLTKILLPNIRASLLMGTVMTFAHTVGEFGVVLMVGGSIPQQTRVASVAIFDEVQAMNYHNANVYSAILFGFTFVALFAVYLFSSSKNKTVFF